jgi:hypothetical protein
MAAAGIRAKRRIKRSFKDCLTDWLSIRRISDRMISKASGRKTVSEGLESRLAQRMSDIRRRLHAPRLQRPTAFYH